MSEGIDLTRAGVRYPPFTDAEVVVMNQWQEQTFLHPFQCRYSHRRPARLIANNDGWHCPRCRYVQPWAHEFQLSVGELHALQIRIPTPREAGE